MSTSSSIFSIPVLISSVRPWKSNRHWSHMLAIDEFYFHHFMSIRHDCGFVSLVYELKFAIVFNTIYIDWFDKFSLVKLLFFPMLTDSQMLFVCRMFTFPAAAFIYALNNFIINDMGSDQIFLKFTTSDWAFTNRAFFVEYSPAFDT